MDFETADGSQFSLREQWVGESEPPRFAETLITAIVDGKPYVAKTALRVEDIDEGEALQNLEAVPIENIFPPYDGSLHQAPPFNPREHYLKAPQFVYDDIEPGQTFVADCLLREAKILQKLQEHHHGSLAEYLGCVVREKRVTHLCLRRYDCNIVEYLNEGRSREEVDRLMKQVRAGVDHLHSLGLAHNDIVPNNICIDFEGNAVLIDFDACRPFGEPLMKGNSTATGDAVPLSGQHNDFNGLRDLEDYARAFTRDYPD